MYLKISLDISPSLNKRENIEYIDSSKKGKGKKYYRPCVVVASISTHFKYANSWIHQVQYVHRNPNERRFFFLHYKPDTAKNSEYEIFPPELKDMGSHINKS